MSQGRLRLEQKICPARLTTEQEPLLEIQEGNCVSKN
jgi:hypothetical protein